MKKAVITIYRAENSEYSWRLRTRNGRIVATAGETYKRKSHCLNMVKKIFGGVYPVKEIA
jgi:uncharacterized protein YegP (UPF0339 family)